MKSPQREMAAPHPASVGRGFALALSHTATDPLLIGCDDETFEEGVWGLCGKKAGNLGVTLKSSSTSDPV